MSDPGSPPFLPSALQPTVPAPGAPAGTAQTALQQTFQNLVTATNAILTQLKQITPALITASASAGITAFASGGQTNATQLSAQFNQISTAASASASVKLLTSAAGIWQAVANAGANAIQVFAHDVATINGIAGSTGISIPAGHSAIFFCPIAGAWYSVPTSP